MKSSHPLFVAHPPIFFKSRNEFRNPPLQNSSHPVLQTAAARRHQMRPRLNPRSLFPPRPLNIKAAAAKYLGIPAVCRVTTTTQNSSKVKEILLKINQHHFHTPPTPSNRMSFSEADFVTNLEAYFKGKSKPADLDHNGNCNGFTLMWMYFKTIGQLDWFYNIKYLICQGDLRQFTVFKDEINFFYEILSFWQNPSQYDPTVHQNHLEKMVDLPSVTREEFLGGQNGLISKLSHLNSGDLTFISSLYNARNHVLGVSFNGSTYSLFDTRYTAEGKEKEFYTLQSLVKEIARSLQQATSKIQPLNIVRGVPKNTPGILPLNIATVKTADILDYQKWLARQQQPTLIIPSAQAKLSLGTQ